MPGALGRFAAVERRLLGHDLAEAADAVLVDPGDDERPVVLPAEARLEKVDIGQLQERHLDAFDCHGSVLSSVFGRPTGVIFEHVEATLAEEEILGDVAPREVVRHDPPQARLPGGDDRPGTACSALTSGGISTRTPRSLRPSFGGAGTGKGPPSLPPSQALGSARVRGALRRRAGPAFSAAASPSTAVFADPPLHEQPVRGDAGAEAERRDVNP